MKFGFACVIFLLAVVGLVLLYPKRGERKYPFAALAILAVLSAVYVAMTLFFVNSVQ